MTWIIFATTGVFKKKTPSKQQLNLKTSIFMTLVVRVFPANKIIPLGSADKYFELDKKEAREKKQDSNFICYFTQMPPNQNRFDIRTDH